MVGLKWQPFLRLLLVGTICRFSSIFTTAQAPDDDLETVEFTLSTEYEVVDNTVVEFSGITAHEMIESVRIEYFDDGVNKYIRCVGFTYGDQPNNCPEEPEGVNQIANFPMEQDEYITHVSGEIFLYVLSIWFKTNKDREIGPFGTGSDHTQHAFQASHNGAPLLYVEGLHGLWLYNINFTFHEYGVLALEDKANQVADRTYTAIKSDIEDLYLLKADYERMLPDVAKKGCYLFDTDPSIEVEIACDLEHMLDQINILISASTSLKNHAPRNLLELKDYDSAKYLDEVQEAKNFHNLITEIKFDLNTVINVTQQQSEDLSAYFASVAEFDTEIAEQDLAFIQGQLDIKSAESELAAAAVGTRLTNILAVGMSVAMANVVEQAVEFGAVLAANLNPFKWIFGGPDIDAIMESLEELMEAINELVQFITLMAHLEEFVDYAYEIVAKFAENQEAIDAMEELVGVLQNETDADVIQQYADDFIQSYGDYSPAVSSQEITYAVTLLDQAAAEACATLADVEGMVSETAITAYEASTLDCVYVFADIAVLGSYFEDIYTLQFEMIDALTSIVKGEIAVSMAGRIGEIENSIDIRTAAIGTAMVETTYQAASLSRCDILEYLAAGKRPTICETLLFRDDDIQKLIAYVGSESSSYRTAFAYIPTYPQADPSIPYINITRLLRGEYETLRLPMADKLWMKDYGWLPGTYPAETAFFVELIEIYLPGIKCNETDEDVHTVSVTLLTGNPTPLYSEEAPPKYTVDNHVINFEYTEPSSHCAGDVIDIPLMDNETMQIIEEKDICIVSHGHVNEDPLSNDFTYPSLFTTFTMQVTGHHSCTLVVDEDAFDYEPLVTARYIVNQVYTKKINSDPGIDECWPDESRCAPEDFCIDEELDYCCQDSQGTCV